MLLGNLSRWKKEREEGAFPDNNLRPTVRPEGTASLEYIAVLIMLVASVGNVKCDLQCAVHGWLTTRASDEIWKLDG